MRRLELLYVWYGWTVAALLFCCGGEVQGRWLWFAGHLAVLVPAWLLSRWRRDWLRYLAIFILLPGAFTGLGQFIADLVPAPFEWRVRSWDEWIGGDRVLACFADPPAWLVELCQLCYSSFYFLPLVLAGALVLEKKGRVLPDCAELLVGGFLLSYLGYLLMPTLPPYRFLDYETALRGGPLFGILNPLLHRLEGLRQDCMPSGHTMMTLLTITLAWRYSKRQLCWLAPIGGFLILGTIVLRYHWFVDLVVALPFTGLALLLFGRRTPSWSLIRSVRKA